MTVIEIENLVKPNGLWISVKDWLDSFQLSQGFEQGHPRLKVRNMFRWIYVPITNGL
jgi:hypothetical protein